MRTILAILLTASPALAFEFDALEGGVIDLEALRGGPVLVVNTASLCGFTSQYAGLQELHERYGPAGLTVLAVPSSDFRQELGSAEDVAEFCEVNYGLTFPMATITPVTGTKAHPFYHWLAETYDAVPRWNFNKALLSPEGELVAFHDQGTPPARLAREIEALLAQ